MKVSTEEALVWYAGQLNSPCCLRVKARTGEVSIQYGPEGAPAACSIPIPVDRFPEFLAVLVAFYNHVKEDDGE